LASQHDDKFLIHVTTFRDLRTTAMTDGDDILMTLKTIGEDTLTPQMTSGEDTLTTAVATRDHFVTTPNDVTDDPCDDIDDQEQVEYVARLMVGDIPDDNKDGTVTSTMTNDPK